MSPSPSPLAAIDLPETLSCPLAPPSAHHDPSNSSHTAPFLTRPPAERPRPWPPQCSCQTRRSYRFKVLTAAWPRTRHTNTDTSRPEPRNHKSQKLTGKIFITFNPFPTQNALTPPPSAYIRPIAPHRFATARVLVRNGCVRDEGEVASGSMCVLPVVMRYTFSRSKGAVTLRDTGRLVGHGR
jgi:hypothetical protein